MKVWIALLRRVNVGGHKKLPMARFRAVPGNPGYQDVASYSQSGNAVFRAAGDAGGIAKHIAATVDAFFIKPPMSGRNLRSAMKIAELADTP